MKILITLSFFLISSLVYGQSDTSTSFLSKLYFPFDFGYSIPAGEDISTGSFAKTALEYRIKSKNGLFVRFNYNNRLNKFSSSENLTTNVIDGNIKFSDYILGLGYRIGNKNFRAFGMCQGGISSYEFPIITGLPNKYVLKDQNEVTGIVNISIGLEYYIAKNAAISIESNYYYLNKHTEFWGHKLNVLGISFGLTTTLF